ncbi:EpsG family protein [Ralstonia sp. NFACC01]|uniref:EpsG family protein n=1 Tax=Ralstonia sp. NFACC01 TaxID=1566294 RepID=UPI0008F2BA3C|nr:EpsG family protein [Ralstonia sp. NFACC01]SFP43621.1 EpsG family protein [Ralstonia sp. NFACC01]
MLIFAYLLSIIILVTCGVRQFRWLWIPVALLWMVLCAFRQGGVGSDLGLYIQVFDYLDIDSTLAAARDAAYGWEPGYVLLMLFSKRLGINGATYFLAIITAFNFVVLLVFLIKNSKNPSIAFLYYLSSYLIWQQFVLVRQSIAISMLLIGVLCLLSEKRWRALFFFLIGCTFHFSAIVVPLFVLAYRATRRIPTSHLGIISFGISIPVVVLAGQVPLGDVFSYLNQLRDYSSYIDGGAKNFLSFAEAGVLLLLLLMISRGKVSEERNGFLTPEMHSGVFFGFSVELQARLLALIFPVYAVAANFEVINRLLEYDRLVYAIGVSTIFEASRGRRAALIAWVIVIIYSAARFMRFYLTFDQGALQDFVMGWG